MEIIKQEDSKYPKKLLEIKNPPKQLYVEGNSKLLESDSIAIVGSRNYTKYGETYAKQFASELSKRKICIVSGLAVGIDSISHINSMKNKGRTIAVLGSGFNYIYPEQNKYLYEKILENEGCIVSEYPPETPVDKSNFPERNRIVSGLSMGVLVVEARYRSGTTITAKHAIEQGRPVFCIPNKLGEPTGYSTNKLIQNGAKLVMDAKDILKYYYTEKEQYEEENMPEDYQEIYNMIGQLPISSNEISKYLKKPIAQVTEVLFMLELNGYIENMPGNLYVRKH